MAHRLQAARIVCDGNGGHEWLRFNRELSNFTFRVKWRFKPLTTATPKYNSGVFFRNNEDGSIWHQAQTALDGGYLFGETPVDGKPSVSTAQKYERESAEAGRAMEYLRYPLRQRHLHAGGERGSGEHHETVWIKDTLASSRRATR